MNISVFGLGKLGAPLAVLLASKGHDVTGYDIDPRPGELLAKGIAPVPEPGLAESLVALSGSFTAARDPAEAVRRSSATFIVVPTPSDDTGGFSTRYAEQAASTIGAAVRGRSEYHLVVLTSTVMPGATRQAFVPALETAAGTRCGEALGVCYNPEFIALGSVLHDMLHPDLVLIGESDGRAGQTLESIYRTVCSPEVPIARMSFENAEIAKLALNTFVTMKITFANGLADICERVPTGDVDAVSRAVGFDSRVGRKYLSGGTGYGGPCFPRDVIAFNALTRRLGLDAPLATATDQSNRARLDAILARVLDCAAPGSTVGVLGLSYKPGTPVIECSQGVELAAKLVEAGRRVVVYDPMAHQNAQAVLGTSVQYSASTAALLDAVDTAVIMTAWPEFQRLPASAFKPFTKPKTIIDCWRIIDKSQIGDAAKLVDIGRVDSTLKHAKAVQ